MVGGQAAAVLGRAVAQGLELGAGGGLAGAKGPLELAFGRGVALGGLARHFLEAVVPLDLPHQGVHPLVVVAIADDLALAKSIRLATMWMWSCVGVGVPGEDVLILIQVHSCPELLPDLAPLLVAELFAGRGREGDVQHGFSDAGPQIPDRLELGREFAWAFPRPYWCQGARLSRGRGRRPYRAPRKPLPLTALAIMAARLGRRAGRGGGR